MNPFGKKLGDKGSSGQSDHYYDGMILRRELTGEDQTTV
jgi:hypothetical protein